MLITNLLTTVGAARIPKPDSRHQTTSNPAPGDRFESLANRPSDTLDIYAKPRLATSKAEESVGPITYTLGGATAGALIGAAINGSGGAVLGLAIGLFSGVAVDARRSFQNWEP